MQDPPNIKCQSKLRKPRSTPSRVTMALQLMFSVLLVRLSATEVEAADWRVSGVYAYEANDWDARVGQHLPLVVFRYYTGQPVDEQVAKIRKLSESGNRVIVIFEFMSNIRQRRSLEPPPPFDLIRSKLRDMLDGLEGIRVEAISLDEENSLSEEKIEYLNQLYKIGKTISPHRNIVQWVVPRKKGGKIQSQGIHSLNTDGWIIDPYLASSKDYLAIVDTLKEISKPIYSVVWAAPGWNVSAGYRVHAKPEWWNQSQWKTFYNRLAVNQENNISTIFYLYGIDRTKTISIWNSNKCDQKFYDNLINITIPYYRNNMIPTVLPNDKPEWIPTYCR